MFAHDAVWNIKMAAPIKTCLDEKRIKELCIINDTVMKIILECVKEHCPDDILK